MLRRRSARKRTITDNLNAEIDNILTKDVSNIVLSEANALLKSLIETRIEVKKYDDVIADLIEEEEDLDKEFLDAHKFDIDVKKKEERLNDFIKRNSKIEEQHNNHQGNGSEENGRSKNKCRVKLPVITIKPFDGQPIYWNSFIEQFNATIDVQEELTDIEKLTYLKGFRYKR